MVILVLILSFFFGVPSAHAEEIPQPSVVDVIFDPGDPADSVGIVNQEFLETGTLYENVTVIAFEPGAIVVKETATDDPVKWLRSGEVDGKIRRHGRELFIAKQMKAIHQAQTEYLKKFSNGYAKDLNTLIDQGLLPDGFEQDQKQNYRFRILETGETRRMAPNYLREPTFRAIAEPLDPEADPMYFSVDQLGQVRFAPSARNAAWGPVWDYADTSGGPRNYPVVHDENE